MFRRAFVLLLIAAGACSPKLGGAGYQGSTSPRGYPLAGVTIRSGGHQLALVAEVAGDDQARSVGLMNVKKLRNDQGMIFLFPSLVHDSFYMKNTLIPLDIAFWDQSMKITDILQMQPCTADPCRLYTPANYYYGSIEVNKGLLERAGIETGATVRIAERSQPSQSP
jgi:uncharacterized protein